MTGSRKRRFLTGRQRVLALVSLLGLVATLAAVGSVIKWSSASADSRESAKPTPTGREPGPFVTAASTPFVQNTEGHACYRIPTTLATKSGTLLAVAEGRVDDCSDVGHNDLVLKRSTNGGRTWGPMITVRGARDTLAYGNPTLVEDAASGRVSLLYAVSTWTPKPNGERERGPRSLAVVHSVDGGATWTDGTSLAGLKDPNWAWVSVGPGHGVQLTRGPNAGRLVVAGEYTTRDTAGAQLLYSDDGGLTWRRGASSSAPKTSPYPAELSLVELADGGLYVNARSSATCGTNEHRLTARTAPGGTAFTSPFAPVPNLDGPPVFGSLQRVSATDKGASQNRIVLSAPVWPGPVAFEDRRMLAVRSSFDEGKTWRDTGLLVVPGRSGYSDLTMLRSGALGLLYEAADNKPHGTVHFRSIAPAELDATTPLRLPRTSDTTPNKNHAVVHGGAVLGDRGSGDAMVLDGVDDFLRIPGCTPSLRLDAGDFTVTAWFKYSAPSGGHPILWAYGQGAGTPQLFLRAEPNDKVVRGAIDVGGHFASVQVPGAYNDGKWHFVAFRRTGGKLLLSVDGGPEASGRDPGGSVTPEGPFNIHVGARPDYQELFTGSLDDIRIFARALSPQEYLRVKNGALDVATDQEAMRLGFGKTW